MSVEQTMYFLEEKVTRVEQAMGRLREENARMDEENRMLRRRMEEASRRPAADGDMVKRLERIIARLDEAIGTEGESGA